MSLSKLKKIGKYYSQRLKYFVSRTIHPYTAHFARYTNGKEIQVCTNQGLCLCPKGDVKKKPSNNHSNVYK